MRFAISRGIFRDAFAVTTLTINGKISTWQPAEWIAEGHVTCNIQCSAKCDRRMVDVRLDALPQDLPWSMIARRLVCKECGTAGSVNIVPNWHDRTRAAAPFTKRWRG